MDLEPIRKANLKHDIEHPKKSQKKSKGISGRNVKVIAEGTEEMSLFHQKADKTPKPLPQ